MKKGYGTGLIIILILILVIFASYLSSRFLFKKEKKGFSVVVDNIKGYNYTLDERDSKLMRTKFKELKKVLDSEELNYEEYAKLLASLFVIDLYDVNNKVNKYDIPCLEYIYESEVDKFKKIIKTDFYAKLEDNSDKDRKQELPSVTSIEVTSIEKENIKVSDTEKEGYSVRLSWEYDKDLGFDDKAEVKLVIDDKKLYVVKHSPIMD